MTIPGVRVFHPHAEAQVGFGVHGHVPPRPVRTLAADLELMLGPLAAPGDIQLVRRVPSAAHLDRLAALGLPVPELLLAPIDTAVLPRKHGLRARTAAAVPWAWTPDTCAFFAPLRHHGPLPAWTAALADGWRKDTAAALLAELLPTLPAPAGPAALCENVDIPRVATDLPAVRRRLADLRAAGIATAVLKAPLGTAGRAAFRAPLSGPEAPDDPVDPALQRWLDRTFRTQRAVVIAPWRARLADLSVQLDVRADRLDVLGVTAFSCDRLGRYRGGLIHAPADDFGVFDVLETTARRVGERLRDRGHVGPAGIDAMVFTDDQGMPRLQPLLEVNPRTTVGHVTLALRPRLAPGTEGELRLLGPRDVAAGGREPGLAGLLGDLREAHPHMTDEAGRLASAALPLNDPAHAASHLAVCVVGAPTGTPGRP